MRVTDMPFSGGKETYDNTDVLIHKMKEEYQIEKWKWNQDDFEQMGWHDNPIWAMSFDDDVKFDLDYLFKWVQPVSPNSNYRFWISPATLIFKNPTKFKVEIETDFVNGLEIADIKRKTINGKTNYLIETQEGRIIIETEEYEQIIRRPPSLQISQSLPELERGEYSFSRIPDKEFKPSKEIIERRELSYRYDELRNLKANAQIEFEEFDFYSLNPKERLKKKREFRTRINKLRDELKTVELKLEKEYG